MIRKFTSNTQKIGELGEDIACKYLVNKEFSVIERNYTRKWGEIDIIAKKGETLYFIEVKSISKNIDVELKNPEKGYRPEENMHPFKLKRFSRTIQSYLLSNKLSNSKWQIDLLLVYIDKEKRIARVKTIENLVI